MANNNIKEQAAQKEKEWRQLQQLQIEQLEVCLKECQKELTEEKSKLHELKEHFKYNLKLLKDRDAELERYDALFFELKTVSQQKEQEISDLKVKIDELKICAGKETKAREEMQHHYQQRLREKQVEIEQYRCMKDAEINKEHEGLELLKHSLDRRVVELEEELEVQHRQLSADFEEASRKSDHEHRVLCDKMNATILSYEMKVKILTKELELLKAGQESRVQEFEEVENIQRQLEKQLKQKEWELEDVKAMSSARLAELEAKLQQTEQSGKRHLDEFNRKYAEADRMLKEKESSLHKTREAADLRERQLQADMQKLMSKLEESDIKARQLEWNIADLEKEKCNAAERLQAEISDLKTRWEMNISEMSRETVARDVELNALRENDVKLRSEIQEKKHDIERYKRDLALSVEREAALEQSKAQLDLDWQSRYEDLERLQYSLSEDLVRSVTRARDEALAEIRVKEKLLHEKDELVKLLTKERDQALTTLNKHGLMVDRNVEGVSSERSDDRLNQLQQQNDELRQVIRQMRQDMEALSSQIPSAQKAPVDEDYVAGIETELQETRSKCRQLQQKISDMENNVRSECQTLDKATKSDSVLRHATDPERDLARDSSLISSHLKQQNDIIGTLRTEKLELTAQLRKNQLRIVHLENLVDQLSKQPREKQIEIEQLQYELGAVRRRTETEVFSLRQRIADLELQVTEARKEADEYYKASVERNAEATSLANQLSQLKLELAKSNPTINYGAQELLIQQLQDEVARVRKQTSDSQQNGEFNGRPDMEEKAFAVSQLQEQLRRAAKRIAQLAKEKQVLIEVGNRLRAQLLKNGIRPPSPLQNKQQLPAERLVSGQHEAEPSVQRTLLQQNVQNKLKELEELQYNLTKQELAARRKPRHAAGQTYVQRSDSDGDQPRSILKQPSRVHDAVVSTDVRSSPRRATPEPNQLIASMSSFGGGDSLQEVWAMMESDGSSSRSVATRPAADGVTRQTQSQHEVHRAPSADSWTVHGSRTKLQSKSGIKSSQPSRTMPRGNVSARKSKIRNYNVKDDS